MVVVLQAVARKVNRHLDQHDREDSPRRHQAMVLAQTIDGVNSATDFKLAYGAVNPNDTCEMYVDGSPRHILDSFEQGAIRTLIIIGRLLEGFDNKNVSVAAIVRNVGRERKVLFAQFVGRAVRKIRPDDPITTVVVSHQQFRQRDNFDVFDKVTDYENEDED